MHGERKEGKSFLLLFNGSSNAAQFKLPKPPWPATYVLIVDTYVPFIYTGDFQAGASNIAGARAWKAGDDFELKAWSMAVLGITGR